MQSVQEFAPAKVNLFLHVVRRRSDGYHDIDSLVAFSDVGDEIELSLSAEDRVTVSGPFSVAVPADDSNLAIRAVRALGEAVGRDTGVHVRIQKNLPVAAGIGGGSSDAAAVLRGLARLWALEPSLAFPQVAASLGADVPVCLFARASRVRGFGDIVEPHPLPRRLPVVLVNCGRTVSTAAVFAANRTYGGGAGDSGDDIVAWLGHQRNDLEPAAVSICPEIGTGLDLLRQQPSCSLARMSGSGATCFGIFTDLAAAQAAACVIQTEVPDWWCVAAELH